MTLKTIDKGKRVTGADAERAAKEITKLYVKGASIREIAEQCGRSYGWVHRTLSNAGVDLRGRGGATRKSNGKARASK